MKKIRLNLKAYDHRDTRDQEAVATSISSEKQSSSIELEDKLPRVKEKYYLNNDASCSAPAFTAGGYSFADNIGA